MAMKRIAEAVSTVGFGRSTRFGKLFREKIGLSPRDIGGSTMDMQVIRIKGYKTSNE